MDINITIGRYTESSSNMRETNLDTCIKNRFEKSKTYPNAFI